MPSCFPRAQTGLAMTKALTMPRGFRLLPEYLNRAAQENLMAEVRKGIVSAPFFQPRMPKTGQKTSVVNSNFGALGWVAGISGYRYQREHPKTGAPWPPMPDELLQMWRDLTHWPDEPEACLINWYREGSRLGLHVDRDEHDLNAPLMSISLGDAALYRLGGPKRNDRTRSFRLTSGDVVVMEGEARKCHHGVDRIYPGTSTLIPRGGRINLTLRVVGSPS